jgi:Domain of unknown function (DUF4167)
MRQGPNHRRSRGRGPRRPHNNNNNVSPRSQTFDSAGPDVRIRGNAYQVLEKYLAMARDATSAGDRVAAENFYQHAEHYFRIVSANGGDRGGPNGRNGQGMRPDGQPADGQGESGEAAVSQSTPSGNGVGSGETDNGEDPGEGQA